MFEEQPPPRGRDPRRDPSEPPARTARPEAGPVPSILPLVGAGVREPASQRAEGEASSAAGRGAGTSDAASAEIIDLPAPKFSLPPSEPAPAPLSHQITCDDPRLPELEQWLAVGDWARVIELLGPPEAAGRLPPPLGLAYAVARKEVDAASLAAADESGQGPNQLAMRCMAALLAVSDDSPLTLVLTKRLLRQNPVSWRKRRAPAAHVSFLIVLLALLVGAGAGYLLSFGYITVRLPG